MLADNTELKSCADKLLVVDKRWPVQDGWIIFQEHHVKLVQVAQNVKHFQVDACMMNIENL